MNEKRESQTQLLFMNHFNFDYKYYTRSNALLITLSYKNE